MTRLPTVKLKDVIWQDTYVTKIHDNPPYESQWLYNIKLPDWLAVWDVFAAWEFEHVMSMRQNLSDDDILFDIGAEIGWQSVIFSRMVGSKNMVLIEPADELWPNIKAIWDKNNKEKPLNCYCGLFSDKTTNKIVLSNNQFPKEASGELVKGLSYRYIHEHGDELPQITLDDYVKSTGIIPNALTIDVEGAELLVLKGAENTLRKYDIKIWLSIHPELLLKNYNTLDTDVISFLSKLGYKGVFLASPCEEHWYFRKAQNG